MKIIAVTGTPGTGKTTVAKRLAEELGYCYVDVKELIKNKGLKEKYDEKRECDVVDIEKLEIAIKEIVEDGPGYVIDSHLSHHLSGVDFCVVTKCELSELKKRLEARGYNDEKVDENMQCEIFDICLTEAKDNGLKTIVIDTGKEYGPDIEKVKKEILEKK